MTRGRCLTRPGALRRALVAALLLYASPAHASSPELDNRAILDQQRVRQGIGDLFLAARSGHPSLLQEAERGILAGLVDGLAASMATGSLDHDRYMQAYSGFLASRHLFGELPYVLEVDPGAGLPAFSLPVRRHPWWDLEANPPEGWQVVLIESGARLVARPR